MRPCDTRLKSIATAYECIFAIARKHTQHASRIAHPVNLSSVSELSELYHRSVCGRVDLVLRLHLLRHYLQFHGGVRAPRHNRCNRCSLCFNLLHSRTRESLFESDSHSTILNFTCIEPIGELRWCCITYSYIGTMQMKAEFLPGAKKENTRCRAYQVDLTGTGKKNYAVHAKSSLCLAPPVHSVPGQGISFMEYSNIF